MTSQTLKFVDLSKNRNLAILRTKHRFFRDICLPKFAYRNYIFDRLPEIVIRN